jgi:hypothetical protein
MAFRNGFKASNQVQGSRHPAGLRLRNPALLSREIGVLKPFLGEQALHSVAAIISCFFAFQ